MRYHRGLRRSTTIFTWNYKIISVFVLDSTDSTTGLEDAQIWMQRRPEKRYRKQTSLRLLPPEAAESIVGDRYA